MRFCGMCGAPLAAPAQRERRNVSVVFIDLAGFTRLTHGLDPEQTRDLADEVLTNVAGIIEEFAGHVDAFRGDGLIAVFGAPRSHADDPERAVNAAAAGLRAIERIGAAKGTDLKGRAGVSTGTVIAGELGSGRVREYTVMGSAVNLAARVEAAATPGEVWVSPATYQATRFRMNFEPSPPVKLEGFPDVTELYILRSAPEPLSVDPYAHLTFVGRHQELRQLQQAHQQAIDSNTVTELWIAADSGLGKSRLLREFTRDHLAAPARILWPAERSGSSLSWYSLARSFFAQDGGTIPQLSEMERWLEECLPHEPRWRRQILASIGLLQMEPWTRLERRRVNRTSLAWRDLLLAIASREQRSLILVIENNVQDHEVLEMLQLLREASAPILLLRTTRSGEVPETGEVLNLPPLSVNESLELLNQVADPVMRRATEALVYQVGGVPSYILELGRALTVTEDSSFSGSLEAVLQARLDRLKSEDRRLLALAALTGERSWESQLLAMAGPEAPDALKRMLLEKTLLVLPESRISGEVEYRFQSELLRHAVLRMVPYSERPLAHLRIATWLEERAPFELSELIAWHFREGGSHDAAWPHYLTALEHALETDTARVPKLVRSVLRLKLPADQQLDAWLASVNATLALRDAELATAVLQADAATSIQSPAAAPVVAERLDALRQLLDELEPSEPEPG